MSKREMKHIERRAFERGIIATVSAAAAAAIGFELFTTNQLGFAGMFGGLGLLVLCIRGVMANGTL